MAFMGKATNMMRALRGWTAAALTAACLGGTPGPAWAQSDEEGESDVSSAPTFAPETRAPDLDDYTKDTTKIDGLFPIYRFPRTGKVLLEVHEEQLDKDFLYFAMAVNGVVEAGHYRGAHVAGEIVHFHRQFDRVEIVAQNTAFYFDPDSALARAADANISPAILTSAPIVAASKDGKRLVLDVTVAFLTEALQQVKPSGDPYAVKGEDFALGKLSPDKTRYRRIRNYPGNTDVEVAYTFDNPEPLHYGDEDITDGRAVTITLQHSFIALHGSDYEPRLDDWRVGYFTDRVTDLTSASFTPYRDLINRWNLKKLDPEATLSDPVKPITFWLENTTPVEFRDIIRDAALSWNAAFKAAGFTNAVAVEIQPDDANWDAGDVRYNVIRWTSSPDPQFGGVGPRLSNPRTGEIVSADIMLEYVFVTNRMKRQRMMGDGAGEALGLLGAQNADPAENTAHTDHFEGCDYADYLQSQMMLGQVALDATGAPVEEMDRLVEEGLRQLVIHEIGHVLGLQHNMKASSTVPFTDIHDRAATDAGGLTGSIMDYPAINLARPGEPQGSFYLTRPGVYDIWAIEAGYTPSLPDPEAEAARAEAVLARSTDPRLAFGNDADDMRGPGRGIDPRVMVGDLSDDPLAWAGERLAWVDDAMAKLPETFSDPGTSWQPLRGAFFILSTEAANAAIVASRQIGGIEVERANVGQPGAKSPFTPVPAERQKAAMTLLAQKVFAPDAFAVSGDLARRLQLQRRAYDFRGTTEDPKLHGRALETQLAILAHLTDRRTLERLTDSTGYGNTYSAHAMLSDLTDALFAADLDTDVNTYRQNAQTAYVLHLLRILAPAKPEQRNLKPVIYDPVSRAAAMGQLQRIKGYVQEPIFNFYGLSEETLAHRAYLRQIIQGLLAPEGD